jgi:hypothetical protein
MRFADLGCRAHREDMPGKLAFQRRGSGPNEAEWFLDQDASTGAAKADV